MYYGWKPYVSAAERRRKAERAIAKSKKSGAQMDPVSIRGRAIASTFWGKAWCNNMERYSDFSNRLPRGRTYVRNGSVLDLQVSAGQVTARVMGSTLYTVEVKVAAVPNAHWNAVRKDCAGAIDSLVELLQGRFSKNVMERVCQPGTGLFPSPKEISFTCSCPDWASMCKHVAAVLYGIGARLDEKPGLLFELRKVDENELIAEAGKDLPFAGDTPKSGKILADIGLESLFGIEMADVDAPPVKKTRAKTPRILSKIPIKKRTTVKRKVAATSARNKSTAKRKIVPKPSGKKTSKARGAGKGRK
jgi:uncharacterized Zn finger protein